MHGIKTYNTFLSTVDKLSSVHSLSGYERLFPQLVVVWISEHHSRQGGPPTGVVDYVLHYPLDVAVSLGEVQGSQFCGPLPVLRVRLEDAPLPLPLTANDSTHRLKQKPPNNAHVTHEWIEQKNQQNYQGLALTNSDTLKKDIFSTSK